MTAQSSKPRSKTLLALAGVVIFLFGVFIGKGEVHFGISSSANQNQGLPAQLDYSSVNEVYRTLKQKYDGKLTADQLINGLKDGLAESTHDPYTEYFTPQEAKKFSDDLNNSFSGIGAQLGEDADGNLEVIAPIAGAPAAKAGLQSKDIILTINGQETRGLSIDEAVNKIRGQAGTTVKLQIVRAKKETKSYTITRADITVPSVDSKILDGNVGYIKINSFADDTSSLAQAAADKFKRQGVRRVILDLRDNPGGEVSAAVDVASLWMPRGATIMQEKRGNTVVHEYKASGDNPLHGLPTATLINEGSASASEIVAGALHDTKAARLIGEKSYGKGVVQEVVSLRDGAQLKVTVASWYRPNGQNINHKGITPDQTVKLDEKAFAADGTDSQRQAALDYLRKQ